MENDNLRNPFRNEADAFRLLVIVGIGAAPVVVLALLVGPIPALVLGAVLLGIAAWRSGRWLRAMIETRQEDR